LEAFTKIRFVLQEQGFAMPRRSKFQIVNCLALAAMIVAAPLSDRVRAADGDTARTAGWSFSTADQDHPNLSYSDGKKTVFMVGCGHAFVIWAAYPDSSKRPKKADEKAYITIENGKSQMNLTGVMQAGVNDDLPADTTYFFQSDLGYDPNSSAIASPAWQKRQARLFDFLDSGRSLAISAAGKVYVLPAIKVADWKARFKKVC
jgi:hypothetical protein